MAFVLQASQFVTGLQSQTALLLQSLRQIALVSPFNITDVKTALELSQITTFSTSGFDQFLLQMYSLDLDYASLTAAEITILNVMRDYLDPAPYLNCCGTDTPAAANTTEAFNARVGTASFEKEAKMDLADTVTCDVFSIELALAPVGAAPALVASPVTLGSLGCVGGVSVYSKLWIDFVADPATFSYDLTYDFKDSVGASLATVVTFVTF
tara:strand:- start:12088 stop:12720 length:633 start_codon:yes stop_codon:yes gene_type:complete